MTDIVERLRVWCDHWSTGRIQPVFWSGRPLKDDVREAADEIEKLRLQLRQTDQKLDEILERIKKLGI